MEQFLKLLEEEVAVLREMLSVLVIEETAILNGDPPLFEKCYQDLLQLRAKLKNLQRDRRLIQKGKEISAEELEEQTLFSQTKLLVETIKIQAKGNESLKKTSLGSNALPLAEEEKKPPKWPLLLEEDPG